MTDYYSKAFKKKVHQFLDSHPDREILENALYFFLHSKRNYSAWILENLENFKSPYARSMFALVIGFRGELSAIEMMMQEADYFERYYPDHESYDQGPILAVQELAVRFLNDR